MGNDDMLSLNYPPYFTEKSYLKLLSQLLKKRDGRLGGLSDNFAYVTKKLVNLYWKGWLQTILPKLLQYWVICIGNIVN